MNDPVPGTPQQAPHASGGSATPAPADVGIVHLHVHSEYSLLDGAIRIQDLINRVKFLGHKAVAITDHGNLFGAIEFYLKAKEAGIKAIIGCEIFQDGGGATRELRAADSSAEAPADAWHLVLLARSEPGYRALIRIVSDGYLRDQPGEVPVVPSHLLDSSEGLIALSACQRGELGYLTGLLRNASGSGPLLLDAPADHPAAAVCVALREHVDAMVRRFGSGNYYVELIDNNLPGQKELLPDLVTVARHFGLPLVATADAHYLERHHAESHAVLLGIKHGLTMPQIRGRIKNARFHVLDNQEMQKVFQAWPEALANTARIAEQCDLQFKFGQYFLPKFDTGTDESSEDALRRFARDGLARRFESLRILYGDSFTAETEEMYRQRLEYELNVIAGMGFPGYFLIVQDFINWAKEHDIPVGPGRGSGAGSLVAYALRITDLDPIPYNLLFERFLNPERISMPDFDVDFCQDRRDEVIRYVISRYGSSQVAQITTFGKMNAKAVVRDVGRVLELGYGRVDRIAKLIPEEIGITLDDAISREPRLPQEASRDETVADLLRLARELEGLARHCSVHAAGIVISDGPMTRYVPVYKDEGGGLITQYEMKMAEKVGLVKFDFLGLKTLTVIQKAVELVRQRRRPDFNIEFIPLGDKRVYDLISAGHSVGVFQLESSGMRQLIMKLKPSCFEDVIALVALFRPGPLGSGMVDDFIERKHGRAALEYPLPQLEPILKETYGIILYQEQVMKIAGELASYSLGEADLLRRAMGKKDPAVMEKQKSRFVSGSVANGHDEAIASRIFDLMAEFANYGFNKSHSAAYGLVAYQTAYLKVHFPEEFMAAIMTCDLDNTKKIVRYADECRRMKIRLLPPSINRSDLTFSVPAPMTIDFGLAAIKGIGAQSLEPLVLERRAGDAYRDLTDLAHRVNLHQVGKKTLELLIQAGALDDFGVARPRLFELAGDLVKFSESIHEARRSGQRSLFDAEPELGAADSGQTFTFATGPLDLIPGAASPACLKAEKALLGIYLTSHPLRFHREDVRAFGRIGIRDLHKAAGKRIAMVAVLAAVNERLTKNNTRMASVRLEDEDGNVEAVMFEKDLPEKFPAAGTVVCAVGNVEPSYDGQSMRFRLERVESVEALRQEHVKSAELRVRPAVRAGASAAVPSREVAAALSRYFEQHAGDTPVRLILEMGATEVIINTGSRQVQLTDEFLHGLVRLPFAGTAVHYKLYQS